MASRSGRPNILFVFTDQQRPDWFEMNPRIPVRTPHVSALAKRGRWLRNAICASPVCAPSRACLASGLEYDRCKVWGNDTYPPDDMRTYHPRLRDEAGYHVMAVGKHHVGNNQSGDPPRLHCGTDGRQNFQWWGFSDALFNAGLYQATDLMRKNGGVPQDAYMTHLHNKGLAVDHCVDYERRNREGVWTATFPTFLSDEDYFDSWITRNGLALLDRAPTDQPWYMEVNLQNPHHPWDVTESMHALYRDPPVDFPPPEHCTLGVSSTDHQEVRRNWAACVEHLDSCLGLLIDRVKQRGELGNTIIVFSSDHGEMLGDYNQWAKLSPLQASIGVPLMIAGPGITPQAPDDRPMTILDLPATFLEWAGLDPSPRMDSRSMVSYLAGQRDHHRDLVFSGLSAWRVVYDGRYKLVRGYDPQKRVGDEFEEMEMSDAETARLQQQRPQLLFDTHRNENDDVSGEHPRVFARLSAALDAHLAR